MATVLRLVSGAIQGQQEGGQDGKLLELADRDDGHDQPTPSSQLGRDDEGAGEPQDDALASVITQVSARDQQKAAPPPPAQFVQHSDEAGGEVRSTWKNKFRLVAAVGLLQRVWGAGGHAKA